MRPHGHVEEVVPLTRARWHRSLLRHMRLVAPRLAQRRAIFRHETRQLHVNRTRHSRREFVVLLRRRPARAITQCAEKRRMEVAKRWPSEGRAMLPRKAWAHFNRLTRSAVREEV